jgi:hypothetical protein
MATITHQMRRAMATMAFFDLWRAHFGQSISGSAASIESVSVPEPSSLALLLGLARILLLVSPKPHDQAEHHGD